MKSVTKEDVLAFIKTQIHAVISTCGENQQPESALIGFGETDDFELIMGTNKAYRKYKNIQANNQIALVIGLGDGPMTVQLEGEAIELTEAEIEKYLALYHTKVPSAAKFRNEPGQVYFKIIPTWMRYLELIEDGEIIEEFKF